MKSERRKSYTQDECKILTPKEIVRIRRDHGWTQSVFAQYMRTTVRTVGYWESLDSQVLPGEYHNAMLLLLRLALSESKHSVRAEARYRKGLEEVLPQILFHGGVYHLHIFLIRHFNPLKHQQ